MKRYYFQMKDPGGAVAVDRASFPNQHSACRAACVEVCDIVRDLPDGLRDLADVLDLIRDGDWLTALAAFNEHPAAGGRAVTIETSQGVHPGGRATPRNHKPIDVPRAAPSQSDIDENNVVEDGQYEVVRYNVSTRRTERRETVDGVILYGPRARGTRPVLAQATTLEALFRKARCKVPTEDMASRFFAVNDHGNVTEYNVKGEVIGSWV